MQLRLRTKLTLVMTGLVLLVVSVLSGVFVAQLLSEVLLQPTRHSRNRPSHFEQAQRALTDAANEGLRPSRTARRISRVRLPGVQARRRFARAVEGGKDTPSIYEVSITDRDGRS